MDRNFEPKKDAPLQEEIREIILEEAVRDALVQIAASQYSFYQQKRAI